jgi:hypothetical protein
MAGQRAARKAAPRSEEQVEDRDAERIGSVVTVGLFIGPLLVGWMTDVTRSYTKPFELCALICMAGSAASFLCVVPRPAEIPTTAEAGTSTSTA